MTLTSPTGVAGESEQPAKDQGDQLVDVGGFEKKPIVALVQAVVESRQTPRRKPGEEVAEVRRDVCVFRALKEVSIPLAVCSLVVYGR